MTQKEFITGSVKILGLVILLFGVLRFVNHAMLAGTLHSSTLVMQKAVTDSQARGEDEFKYMARKVEFGNKVQFNLLHLPFDIVQIGFGLYLCRRERRIVNFLVK